MSEYYEIVKHYWKKTHGIYICEMIDYKGLDDCVKKLNTMPLHIGAFVIPNSKRSMNIFIHAINRFFTNHLYYTDTDSLYIENKH